MDEQMIQQTIIVPQESINRNRSVERKSFFNKVVAGFSIRHV